MTFKIGMKVVCVDAVFQQRTLPLASGGCAKVKVPELHGVYTIRGIDPEYGSLLLEEIINPIFRCFINGDTEAYFRASRFRPAVSPKQQVSFTTGAPRDSRKWDNRRKRVEVVS